MDIARYLPAPRRDQPVSIGIGFSGMIPHRGLRAAISLAGLGGTLWYVAGDITLGWSGAPLAALVSVVVAGLSWLVWLAADVTGRGHPSLSAASVTLAAAGGVLATSGDAGLVFIGVGAGGAAIAFDLPVAAVLAATGPAAFGITAAIRDALPGSLLSVALVTLAGLVGAAGRREMVQRTRQQTLIATAHERAEVIRREAELVGERNRLGRELHDVLAHTLGALSIQLTALDTLARTGAGRDHLRQEIARGQQLVGEGLDEARQAVRALRDDQTPLDAQLRRLAQQHRAHLDVTGTPRPLRPEPALALYRVAQEALTNAAKHAPGSAVAVHVTFDNEGVKLTVRNALAEDGTPHPLHGTGGGYGLPGMTERVEQAGGQAQAGPDGDGGWLVTATIPADPR